MGFPSRPSVERACECRALGVRSQHRGRAVVALATATCAFALAGLVAAAWLMAFPWRF